MIVRDDFLSHWIQFLHLPLNKIQNRAASFKFFAVILQLLRKYFIDCPFKNSLDMVKLVVDQIQLCTEKLVCCSLIQFQQFILYFINQFTPQSFNLGKNTWYIAFFILRHLKLFSAADQVVEVWGAASYFKFDVSMLFDQRFEILCVSWHWVLNNSKALFNPGYESIAFIKKFVIRQFSF